ncbi:MAG: hypothetical protein KIH08_04725 [Candidatus Freyarchaeota archaeon]|nr:hypothetical protein [Candidatus Jordarchaeia archaeon]MBS7279641.1 hypothetical protein [Candidatus Jordarchaeia archaeon]
MKVVKRAGQIFSLYLLQRSRARKRVLPDFLIASHIETYSEALVTWYPEDFKDHLNIQALTPPEAVDKLSD